MSPERRKKVKPPKIVEAREEDFQRAMELYAQLEEHFAQHSNGEVLATEPDLKLSATPLPR